MQIPVIDIAALVQQTNARAVAEDIGRACRTCGFFYIVGHAVSVPLQARLEELSRAFFALDSERKNQIRMSLGGRAWRGFFPVGNELTSGKPDQKEGIYFGRELPADDPRVLDGRPLHGPNLFPDIPDFRATVLDYLQALEQVGHALMRGLALSLDLDENYFADRYTNDPLILFRIFHYPPIAPSQQQELWSVGEHTDYGLLTILRQDHVGGLQIRTQSRWIDAPVLENSFVCNIGDMLDRMTGGEYRSTLHRVRNRSREGRLSFPFFFDPAWTASVQPVRSNRLRHNSSDDKHDRWDNASVHDWSGTYGDYILQKISRVFPELSDDTLDRS